ncbi:MAG: flagellar assembly protein FliH [Deltaproteobacteria bacterium]|nr:flagellar assembly protein FliH [Deltaproteobacteria bacterium]
MSSSRIIKSVQNSADKLTEFSFRPIGHLAIAAPPDGAAGFVPTAPPGETAGFIPMGLLDTSEAGAGYPSDQDVTPQEPPGITLTEEEFERRLRESYESGLRDGKSLAERGLLNVFTSLRTAADGLHALRDKVLRESEEELIRLIMIVARKVILREVAQDRRILAEVVQAAIADISGRDEITIHLNPDDYAQVSAGREDFFHKEAVTERMQFKADPAVLSGSCRIDTDMGTIDASIDSQLDEIFRRLQEERSLSSGGGA